MSMSLEVNRILSFSLAVSPRGTCFEVCDSFSDSCVYAHMYVLAAVSTYVLTDY